MSVSISLHVDGNYWFHLCEYGLERTPILTLGSNGHSVALSAHSDVPIAAQLDFARALITNATGFLAALELFAAANTTTEQAG